MSTITSTTADETLNGSTGDDTYVFSSSFGQDSITDGGGTDTVDFSAITAGLTINLTSGAGNEVTDGTNTVNWSSDVIENAIGGSGNDSITGNTGNNSLSGGAGSDTLSGGAGSDYLDGGDGADTVYGDAGNDTIYNGAGEDDISCGDGDDTIIFVEGFSGFHNDIIRDTGGVDTLDFSSMTSDITARLTDTLSNAIYTNDALNHATQSGTFENAIGGSGNDTLWGNDSNNYLVGGTGNDYIRSRDWL
jgi:serralysin